MKGKNIKSFFSFYGITIAATILLIGGIIIGVWGHIFQYGKFKLAIFVNDLYANIGTELIGISITVLVLDRLYHQRQLRLEEERQRLELMNKVRSQVNDQAKLALEQLIILDLLFNRSLEGKNFSNGNLHQARFISFTKSGGARLRGTNFKGTTLSEAWLNDADLSFAVLRYAKLQKAHLFKTNLQEADMLKADLEGAYLFKANLQKASLNDTNIKNASIWDSNLFNTSLSDTQLQSAYRLRGSILPNGSRYDGRFNLPGDIQDAKEDGIDIENQEAMAAWYVVPLEDYQNGQK